MCCESSDFFIAWADPGVAASYRVADLNPRDAARATLPRGARAVRDWQVSRALLHSVRTAPTATQTHTLSHKHGHAVCAAAPAGWQIGIDLERIKPRDVMRLADWACSPQEKNMLATLDGPHRLAHFYTLWTLKEAFIKAADLTFPADMARVGLTPNEAGDIRLRAPHGNWQACTWQLEPDWMVSIVWQATMATGHGPHWLAPAGGPLPQRALLGRWQSRLE